MPTFLTGTDREAKEALRSGRQHIVHHHRWHKATASDASNPPAGLQDQHAALAIRSTSRQSWPARRQFTSFASAAATDPLYYELTVLVVNFLQTALNFESISRILKGRSYCLSSSLAFNHFNPASFAGNDDLYLREDQTRLHRNAIMQGLPLGSARGKRIRVGVALYSPALKIYPATRLCHRQTHQGAAANLLPGSDSGDCGPQGGYWEAR
jgi:hypothetical protein